MRSRLSGRRSSHPMSAIVSGLDVHKEYTYATILGQGGEKLAQGRMPNEEVPAFLKPYRVERRLREHHFLLEHICHISLKLFRRLEIDTLMLFDIFHLVELFSDEHQIRWEFLNSYYLTICKYKLKSVVMCVVLCVWRELDREREIVGRRVC